MSATAHARKILSIRQNNQKQAGCWARMLARLRGQGPPPPFGAWGEANSSPRDGVLCVFSQRAETLYQEMSVAFSLPGLTELLSSLEANGREGNGAVFSSHFLGQHGHSGMCKWMAEEQIIKGLWMRTCGVDLYII